MRKIVCLLGDDIQINNKVLWTMEVMKDLEWKASRKNRKSILETPLQGGRTEFLSSYICSVKLGCGKLTMANVAQVCTKLKDAS